MQVHQVAWFYEVCALGETRSEMWGDFFHDHSYHKRTSRESALHPHALHYYRHSPWRFCPKLMEPRLTHIRRDTHGVFASACWEDDRWDRDKSIWSVTTGPDLPGVWFGLILTRVRFLQRSRINIREQRGLRMKVRLPYTRRTAPVYSVLAHPQHTYIHRHTHAHTHIQVTCEIAYCNCILRFLVTNQ